MGEDRFDVSQITGFNDLIFVWGNFSSLWVIRRKLSVDPSWLIFERELLSFRVIRTTPSVHPSWLTILSDTLCMPEYLLSTLNRASIYVLPWVLANKGSFLLSVIGPSKYILGEFCRKVYSGKSKYIMG